MVLLKKKVCIAIAYIYPDCLSQSKWMDYFVSRTKTKLVNFKCRIYISPYTYLHHILIYTIYPYFLKELWIFRFYLFVAENPDCHNKIGMFPISCLLTTNITIYYIISRLAVVRYYLF